MAIDLRTIAQIDGMPFSRSDRVKMGLLNLSYAAGANAGAASVATYNGPLPPGALIIPAGVAGSTVDIALTPTGFTATVTPRNNANTLAAGSAGFFVIA